MKKSLFLLPILAATMLCSCGPEGGGGGGGGGKALSKLTVDYSTIAVEAGTKTGYDTVGGITALDGVDVSFDGVCINNLNSKSKPVWVTPNDEAVQVVQFRASNGEFKVPNQKISKVTMELYTSHGYGAAQFPSVSFGGSKVAFPSKATSTEKTDYQNEDKSGKKFDIELFTVDFECDGSKGDLVISNTNSYALYLKAIIIIA